MFNKLKILWPNTCIGAKVLPNYLFMFDKFNKFNKFKSGTKIFTTCLTISITMSITISIIFGIKHIIDYLNDNSAEPLVFKIYKHDKYRIFDSVWKKIYSSRMHYFCKSLIKSSIKNNFYNFNGYIDYSAFDDYTYQTGWYPNVNVLNQVLSDEICKDKFTKINIISDKFPYYDHIVLIPDFELKILNIKFDDGPSNDKV